MQRIAQYINAGTNNIYQTVFRTWDESGKRPKPIDKHNGIGYMDEITDPDKIINELKKIKYFKKVKNDGGNQVIYFEAPKTAHLPFQEKIKEQKAQRDAQQQVNQVVKKYQTLSKRSKTADETFGPDTTKNFKDAYAKMKSIQDTRLQSTNAVLASMKVILRLLADGKRAGAVKYCDQLITNIKNGNLQALLPEIAEAENNVDFLQSIVDEIAQKDDKVGLIVVRTYRNSVLRRLLEGRRKQTVVDNAHVKSLQYLYNLLDNLGTN